MPAYPFGLDIGRSFIKVVQIEKNGGGKKILKAACSVQAPVGAISSESPIDQEKVAKEVAACVEKAGVDSNRCFVSLVESQVISRLIKLPALTDKELSSAISWEAEQYIPLPIKDVTLDYKVVAKPTDSSGQMSVLLVAAPKRMIAKYLAIADRAGLKIEGLEPESSALARVLVDPTDLPTVIVSLGAVSTELVITKDGNVFFTRSIATGGTNLTKALISEFNLEQNQAEQYKQTYGLSEDKLGGKVASILRPVIDILVTEISKACEFASSHIQNAGVSRLILCGGGAYLPGLEPYLAQKTSMEIILGDPWRDFAKEGLILKMAGLGSFYGVATGLALRL